jgi:hypothetical protein
MTWISDTTFLVGSCVRIREEKALQPRWEAGLLREDTANGASSNSSTPKWTKTNCYKLEYLVTMYKFCCEVSHAAQNRTTSILIAFPL